MTFMYIFAHSAILRRKRRGIYPKEIKKLISLSSSKLPDEYLYKAAHKGRLDLVQYFIEEKGFSVNTTMDNHVHGGAILSIDTMGEHIDVIDYLLKKGAIASQGVIPAILNGNVEILEKLFKYGATARDGYSEDLVALLVNTAIPANDPTYSDSSFSETKKDLSNYAKLTLCLVLNIVKMENAAVVAYSHLKALTLFGKPFYRLYLQSF